MLEDEELGGRQFDFTAGQYLTFRFDDLTAKPIVRSYTISSSPNQLDHVAITVKTVEQGIVSHYFCEQLKVGDTLRARGPIGKFVYDPKEYHPHLVMIAAGSGVTPFISILREYADKLEQHPSLQSMSLLVSFQTQKDILCHEVIEQLRETKGVHIQTTLSREKSSDLNKHWQGRIDEQKIHDFIGPNGYQQKTYMICGPQDMMDNVAKHLLANQVESNHIRTESYDN